MPHPHDWPVTPHQQEHDALYAIQLLLGEAADALRAVSSHQARLSLALEELGEEGNRMNEEIAEATKSLPAANRTIGESFYILQVVRQNHFLRPPGSEVIMLDEEPRLRKGSCIFYTRTHEVAEQSAWEQQWGKPGHLPTHAGIVEEGGNGYVLVICTDPHATTEPERVPLDQITFPEWASLPSEGTP